MNTVEFDRNCEEHWSAIEAGIRNTVTRVPVAAALLISLLRQLGEKPDFSVTPDEHDHEATDGTDQASPPENIESRDGSPEEDSPDGECQEGECDTECEAECDTECEEAECDTECEGRNSDQ